METYDVAVVGAGISGLIAARELTQRGLSVCVIEGRDRLGGRTWTDRRLGRDIELGGTWVHNLQPHVFAELRRYGLGLVANAEPERCVVVGADGARSQMSFEDGMQLLDAGLGHVIDGARDLIPFPFDPLHTGQKMRDVDELTAADRLATLGPDPLVRTVAEAFVATGFQGAAEEIGLAHVLRLAALSNWDVAMDLEVATGFLIEGGTRALVEAIAGDSDAEVRLETVVESILDDGEGVTVTVVGGGQVRARWAIVAVPTAALGEIAFAPPLAGGQRAVVDAGQVAAGIKVWARVRGEVVPFMGFADPSVCPLTIAQFEYHHDGDSLIVAFGPDRTAISIDDADAVAAAIRQFLPDAEVVAVDGHDWGADQMTRQTWANPRPRQLTEHLPDFQRPHGRVHIAGADHATGWLSYMDGAVETGLSSARRVLTEAVSR